MAYLPHTEDERQEMLKYLGIDGVDALFEDIPRAARLNRPLELAHGLSEWEVQAKLRTLAAQNRSLDQLVSYLGFGYYDRYIPSAVAALSSRGEFSTAYTPYQAELSQGTLAAIFEFQTMIASLTAMDAAQASMYDGASATAEAALLAMAETGRHSVWMARTLHPEVRRVVQTYIKARSGTTRLLDANAFDNANEVSGANTELPAAIIWPYPDVLGSSRYFPDAMAMANRLGAIGVAYSDPVALAVLRPPGELGADIAVGEGQPLGNPLQYGGPGIGYFAVKQRLVRRLPGRLVGETTDGRGKRGFVLTLQAREQHIRREKAASNVCSNHSLNALQAAIYLSLLGPNGLAAVAQLAANKAHYLRNRLIAIGLQPVSDHPILYEFALKIPGSVASLNARLLESNILGGVDLGAWDPLWERYWQLAVTELRTRQELDQLVEEVRAWMESR